MFAYLNEYMTWYLALAIVELIPWLVQQSELKVDNSQMTSDPLAQIQDN